MPLGPGVTAEPGIGVSGSFRSIDAYHDHGRGATNASRSSYDEWPLGALAKVVFDSAVLDDDGVLRVDHESHGADFDRIGGLLPAESRVGGLVHAPLKWRILAAREDSQREGLAVPDIAADCHGSHRAE